jgi:serine/threonine-protein kinase
MADDPRVQQLLDELLDSNATPEQVCGSCPELLPVVRDRWQELCRLQAGLDAMFPPPGNSPPRPPDESTLPQIPGYEVEAALGRGGMGIVFRARHLRLDRLVAVKMMLAGAYAGSREKDRFQREAVVVAGLRHPNIVQVHDVGEHAGRPYFTLELIDGGNLAHKLAGTPQPARRAAELVATLAGAVQLAHASGIIHRDLKPSNILLTSDGTPKVTDFGLARQVGDGASLTQTGVAVGTPSYMAPEQARGRPGAVGPAVDVYALGAILYELLTGRPPFRAATAAETVQQVISQEPAPPSRLNDQVPRDLETVCLKCLAKEPGRRYASAAALADDLRRFGEGRPIQARPVGWAERSWRWCRRNPTAAALLATALALVGLASGGGVWLVRQQAERRAEAIRQDAELRNEVGTAVAQAVSLRKGVHFREARELLEQARRRLEPAGPDDLHSQVNQGRADLDLAERLDAARIEAATRLGGMHGLEVAEPLYASAFAEAGLGRDGDDVEAVAARVRGSALCPELVAVLDDWAGITPDTRRRAWLLAVARGADPDPARDRLRRPELWQDRAWLTRVAREQAAADLSPQLATALGQVARARGGDAVALLAAVQARYPQDFWLNYELGQTMYEARQWDEALGYYRAALAVRPEVSAAHNGLGLALYAKGRRDEAIDSFRRAVRLDGKSASAHINLGRALYDKGLWDEAIGHLQQAVSIAPESATAHSNLGGALAKKGRHEEAIGHFRHALRINPGSGAAHINLGIALSDTGRPEEAIGHLQQGLRIVPESTVARDWLRYSLHAAACAAVQAAACQGLEKGKPDSPERAGKRRQALEWLRADLELTSKLQKSGQAVDGSLATWQRDPALACVRDPAELAKLPDEEQVQWQQLWADVAALRAAGAPERGRQQK